MLTECIFVIFTIEPCWLNLELRTQNSPHLHRRWTWRSLPIHPPCCHISSFRQNPAWNKKNMCLSSSFKGKTLQGRSWNKCLSARLGLLTRCPMILPRFQTPWKKRSLRTRDIIGCMTLWYFIKSPISILGILFVCFSDVSWRVLCSLIARYK